MQAEQNSTPIARRMESVPTVRLPNAESTSRSPSNPDHSPSPLVPCSWRINDMPALQPSKTAPNGSGAFAGGQSSAPRKYVDIKIPPPTHHYLFVDGAAEGGKGKIQ